MYLPLVSIIIPTYNRSKVICETLDSVLAQTYENWECIIVDDGSTDNTDEIITDYIKKDSRFQYYHRPIDRPKGGNAARNFGFEISKGDYVNWFDSDDIMFPDFINEKINCFSDVTQAVLNKIRYSNYELTRFRNVKFAFSNPQNLFYHYGMEEIEIQTCCLMWKHSFLKGKMLFDENIERYQDNEFHLRMLALKPKINIISKVLATIRGGNGNPIQISSTDTLSKKKLYDIFYCRCQTLLLINSVDKEYYMPLLNKTYTKILWSFYNALLHENNIFKRVKDINFYYDKLNIVYHNKNISIKVKIKSHLFLCYIVIFGNFIYKKKQL